MTPRIDRPDRCHFALWIGGQFIHTCMARYGQPVEPARTLRLVRAAS